MGVPHTHFTHIFIDEADMRLSLKQWSAFQDLSTTTRAWYWPVTRGSWARHSFAFALKFRLDMSMLERIMARDVYMRRRPSKISVVQSTGMYQAVAQLPLASGDFASSHELSTIVNSFAAADPRMRESLCDWPDLPNRNQFPILFHGVQGKEQREGNSPSWFNPLEAAQVLSYIQSLQHYNAAESHWIRLPSFPPYRKQVEKPSHSAPAVEAYWCASGSTEELQVRWGASVSQEGEREVLLLTMYVHSLVGRFSFLQGQERRVIIISGSALIG